MISLPLINEVKAEGLTPDQLRDQVAQRAARYVADPTVSIVVREINSRQVFITGEVNKPGAYSLMMPTSVMQLISLAGGLREYAKTKDIVILRTESGQQTAIPFNYKDVMNRKKLTQNILLAARRHRHRSLSDAAFERDHDFTTFGHSSCRSCCLRRCRRRPRPSDGSGSGDGQLRRAGDDLRGAGTEGERARR